MKMKEKDIDNKHFWKVAYRGKIHKSYKGYKGVNKLTFCGYMYESYKTSVQWRFVTCEKCLRE